MRRQRRYIFGVARRGRGLAGGAGTARGVLPGVTPLDRCRPFGGSAPACSSALVMSRAALRRVVVTRRDITTSFF
jgi:hypothetical protein